MVPMVRAKLGRFFKGSWPRLALFALLLVSLYLMSAATQDVTRFGSYYSWLLAINVFALAVLVLLILYNVFQILRQYHKGIIGSRLTMRLMAFFVLLTIVPVSVVYYFSQNFVRQGIDSWFNVHMEAALEDALTLSRNALDLRTKDALHQSQIALKDIEQYSTTSLAIVLDEHRVKLDASELSVFDDAGNIIATVNQDPSSIIPYQPSDDVFISVQQQRPHTSISPIPDLGLHILIAVPSTDIHPEGKRWVLFAMIPISDDFDRLAGNIEKTYAGYKEASFLRNEIQFTSKLTLQLVLLTALLAAVWSAFFSARRLVAPIRDLAEGTHAVAAGDYGKQLPNDSNDELGFLVRSFNNMSQRIANSRDALRRSQQKLEDQRGYLSAVLTSLSSGVITLDTDHLIQTNNKAAEVILDANLHLEDGLHLDHLLERHPHLEPFVEHLRDHVTGAKRTWRTEVTIFGRNGRQILLCRGDTLPADASGNAGHVVVFDDVTALVQAQRDAAWGEVARRLAHEIKNPLTPIQLSAERMRRKCLNEMPEKEADILDRSTNTIIAQVGTLKEMVNAFAEYARGPKTQLAPAAINPLVEEVLDLFRATHRDVTFYTDLQKGLPRVLLDIHRMRQLLNNLVKNALESTEGKDHRKLNIWTHQIERANQPAVEVVIEDNGPGFANDVLEHLFEPYVTTKAKGTGLGLPIVKKIIEEHNGVVMVDNHPRGGAQVRFCLPVPEETQLEKASE